MRRRLLLALLALSGAALVSLALPLLGSTAAERTQRLAIARTADLDRFATLAEHAGKTGDASQLGVEVDAYHQLYGDAVLVVDAGRHPVCAAGGLNASNPGLARLIDGALRNEPSPPIPLVRPWSRGDVMLARPVGTGTLVAGAVVVSTSVNPAARDISWSWTLILFGVVIAAALFVVLALGVSRWVLRPLANLEQGVLAVAAGRRRTHVPAGAGPQELRELAESFNRMSDAIGEASEQQRRLIADASHQLRNPMAALRLRVDSLAGQVTSRGERAYASTVAEVERLESLLDGLLALASAENSAFLPAERPECAPAAVLHDRIEAWQVASAEAGIRLDAAEIDDGLVGCSEHELSQVLDVLLDNAIKYAGVHAHVVLSFIVDGGTGRISVRDSGSGLPAEEISLASQRFWRSSQHSAKRGTGLGLSIVDRIVTARGGHLAVRNAKPQGLIVECDLPVVEQGQT